MSGGNGLVFPLQENQLLAANPEDNVWLSASAGNQRSASSTNAFALVAIAVCARSFSSLILTLSAGRRARPNGIETINALPTPGSLSTRTVPP